MLSTKMVQLSAWDYYVWQLCKYVQKKYGYISYSRLCEKKNLDWLKKKTKSNGATPAYTLSATLQHLRDKYKMLIFLFPYRPGYYHIVDDKLDIPVEFGRRMNSTGEMWTDEALQNYQLDNYCREKKFPDMGQYRFDFYFEIGGNRCIIEFDGLQHFYPVAKWGGEKALEKNRKRDALKDAYCENNGINLLRIRFDQAGRDGSTLTKIVAYFIGSVVNKEWDNTNHFCTVGKHVTISQLK